MRELNLSSFILRREEILSKMDKFMILHKGIMVISGELKAEAVGWVPSREWNWGEERHFHISFVLSCSLKKKNYSSILLCNLSKKF